VCDSGYSGPDCSDRACKFGIDPLYNDDDIATARVSNWTVNIFTEESTPNAAVTGAYSLTFFDVFGEDWETVPISASAWCDEVIAALESIPNNVIPLNSVLCLDNSKQAINYDQFRIPSTVYDIYRSFILAFPQNPGKLQPLRVNFNLDGPRPTLTTDETTNTLRSLVYADGFSGEFIDNVPDLCEGVLVTLGWDAHGYYLENLDFRELAKIKRCLGDSDGNTDQGDYEVGEVYNWDFGDFKHPHLIKLVDTNRDVEVLLCNSTDTFNPTVDNVGSCQWGAPAGFYLPLFYAPTGYTAGNEFRVIGSPGLNAYMGAYAGTAPVSPGPGLAGSFTKFNVFTTNGFLTSVNKFGNIDVSTSHLTNSIYQKVITDDDSSHVHWHGPDTVTLTGTTGSPGVANARNPETNRIDCETFDSLTYTGGVKSLAGQCLQKGDMVMFFDVSPAGQIGTTANGAVSAWPLHHNIYTIEKIFYDRDEVTSANDEGWEPQGSIVLDKEPNFFFGAATTDLLAWKFEFPKQQDGYEYVSECSGRGLCNHDSGVCECFTGHTSDDCSVQNTLAK